MDNKKWSLAQMGNALYRHPTKQTKDLLKDKEKFEKKMERWTVSTIEQ